MEEDAIASTTAASMTSSTATVTPSSPQARGGTGLQRVPSSPLIASDSVSEVNASVEAIRPNNHNEAEDAFATSGSRGLTGAGGQQQRLMLSSFYRHPSRRERSLSSITSPYTLRGPHNHQRQTCQSRFFFRNYLENFQKYKIKSISYFKMIQS